MRRFLTAAILALCATVTVADDAVEGLQFDHSVIPRDIAERAILLRERALLDNLSVDLVESLTTEVGPRRMGTDGDERAIAWAIAKFEELGFDRVWTEEVPYDHGWIRGDTRVRVEKATGAAGQGLR